MKILFVSYYFEPDLSAGSFRNTALAKEIAKQLTKNSSIDVLTTTPNRYSSYKVISKNNEYFEGINIYRIKVANHGNDIFNQSKSFLFFFLGSIKFVFKKDYDLIYASSGRLMTAFLAAIIAKYKKVPLYLDIRDIFLETILEILPKKYSYLLRGPLNLIEKYTINKAKKINLVSEGFKAYFNKKYKNLNLSYYTNGIDKIFLNKPVINKEKKDKKIILYAGNIGDGQALDKIIPNLALKLKNKFNFVIIGDGSKLEILKKEIKKLNLNNIKFIKPVSRDELILHYLKSDILFLHLDEKLAFQKVLPSKIFEYASSNKPILAGVSGYPKNFIEKNIDNSAVFQPCNIKGALIALKKLDLADTPRENFINRYNRTKIMKNMAEDILNIVFR